jgi:hypothetical protein
MSTDTTTTTAGEPARTRGQARWLVIQERIAQGRCRDCGEKRGKQGTAERCKSCADKRRAYQHAWRARKAAAPATAPELARALGDTAARVPRLRPGPALSDPTVLELGPRERLTMTIRRSDRPSLSVLDPATPWTPDHWRIVIARTRANASELLARLGPIRISAGRGYDGQPPALRDVLALLLQDAADADLPLDAWAARIGASAFDLRVVRNHRAAGKRAAALAQLLKGKARAETERAVLPSVLTGKDGGA